MIECSEQKKKHSFAPARELLDAAAALSPESVVVVSGVVAPRVAPSGEGKRAARERVQRGDLDQGRGSGADDADASSATAARSTHPDSIDAHADRFELHATELTVLAEAAAPLPVAITGAAISSENALLRARHLDLRRPVMLSNLRTRARLVSALRAALDESDFLEIETPTLVRSTPEGAKEFLVPHSESCVLLIWM